VSRSQFVRVVWIAVRIALAVAMMGHGSYFLYQGF
jgi:hypothetical protein